MIQQRITLFLKRLFARWFTRWFKGRLFKELLFKELLFKELMGVKNPDHSANPAHHNAPLLTHADMLALASELAALPALDRVSRKTSQAIRQGEQSSRFMGSGFEYADSRPYQPGDEIRRINWRLMARLGGMGIRGMGGIGRTGQAYTKLFQETRQENWLILVDHRATMQFGTRVRTKAQQAVRVAGYFAWQAQQAAIPVVGVHVAQHVSWSPTLEGYRTYLPLMELFCNAEGAHAQSALLNESAPRLNDVLLALNSRLAQGARVMIISDFNDVDDKTTAVLAQLQYHCDVHAIWIEDQAEQTLPPLSGVTLHAIATPVAHAAHDSHGITFDAAQTQTYQAWLNQYHQTTLQHLNAAGITVSRLNAHEDLSVLPVRLSAQP
ncbi:DUF58 domain-containing protein [Thiomicrorhabdus aquaedulcis]|uniref:DUF58 domain-containing protein n=1 Tax=Thiomicrorhabdus aquaedulcis TaxID=2211106 RepID=UPI000FD8133D|nr:DUF58 domain-containing protein [Thiomicrorhabdus aquaedulcis]